MRHFYKPVKWLLRGFLLLLVVIPLAQKCVLGFLQGKSCKWQPAWSFFATHWVWIVPALLLLGAILFVSRRAELYYQARQREQERLQQARERFNLLKPADKLLPEDLGFHIVKPEESKLEGLAQDQRPFHEDAYISRTAVPYHLRSKEDPRPRYEEEELVDLLRGGKGFVLQGQPTDGKSRTLYQVLRRMGGYEVVSPKANEVPGDGDIELLLKGRDVVLLLEDLTNYVGAGLNLQELGKSLTRNQVRSWVVASTCRDGPELESVRNAESGGLKTFYENIPDKLKLVELTAGEKARLAQSIGQKWKPEEIGDYSTPGSITMKDYKRYMYERFERNLSGLQQDTLRVLKLLTHAGVLPFTHQRIKTLLEAERLFDRHDFHLQRDCLDGLRNYSFIRCPLAQEQVQPEPAYLSDDVVPYIEGKEPEQDFDALLQLLEDIEDLEGLFFLGNTYALNLQAFQKAIEAYDAALEVNPGDAETLINKGSTLGKLGRYEEAIEACDAALEINPDDARARINKGIALSRLGEYEKAIEAYDAVLEINPSYAEALHNKGNTLGRLGEYQNAIEAYDAVLEINPGDAQVLYNKGSTLSKLGRYEKAIEAYDAALEISSDYANALYNKGFALGRLGRHEKAIEAYDAALEINPDYTDALYNKVVSLLLLEREDEAIEHLCRAWRDREHLSDGGASLAAVFAYLSRDPEECP